MNFGKLKKKLSLEGRELQINRLPYDRLLSWCSKKNGEILTTNYDLLFLQSIQKNGKCIKPNEGSCKSTDTFPISRYYYSDINKTKDKVKIWGVNGYVSLSESLRLSFATCRFFRFYCLLVIEETAGAHTSIPSTDNSKSLASCFSF